MTMDASDFVDHTQTLITATYGRSMKFVGAMTMAAAAAAAAALI